MAFVSLPNELLGIFGYTQGKPPFQGLSGTHYLGPVCAGYGAAGFDWRNGPPPPVYPESGGGSGPDLTGTLTGTNRVMLKASSTSPEAPFTGARVRVHRLSDGLLVWQGLSDAQGWYFPTGLQVGENYYPVGIDLTGQHECVAAGPVIAVKA